MIFLFSCIIYFMWWGVSFLPIKFINGDWFLKNYSGMSLAPLIFYKNKRSITNEKFVKHESCHIRQQRRFSPVLFLLLYLLEYILLRTVGGLSHFDAYWNLSWEEEAREAETKEDL